MHEMAETQKKFVAMNQSDQLDTTEYQSSQQNVPPSYSTPALGRVNSSSFQSHVPNEQSTNGCQSSGAWQSYFQLSNVVLLLLLLLLYSVCGNDCTQFKGVECYVMLHCDFGCDAKNGNFVVFESHKNTESLSWRPCNWKLNLPLCKQYEPLLELIDETEISENEGREVETISGKVDQLMGTAGEAGSSVSSLTPD